MSFFDPQAQLQETTSAPGVEGPVLGVGVEGPVLGVGVEGPVLGVDVTDYNDHTWLYTVLIDEIVQVLQSDLLLRIWAEKDASRDGPPTNARAANSFMAFRGAVRHAMHTMRPFLDHAHPNLKWSEPRLSAIASQVWRHAREIPGIRFLCEDIAFKRRAVCNAAILARAFQHDLPTDAPSHDPNVLSFSF
ncbi:hypothetical protein AURDEDRAFT_174191 [Auricularia subglabra TFB-10046 SS5]|nr:hypothetical protein AURDEDRAFT_174191 [Auricularia subglabra TFB-10046 SS5]